MDIGKIVMIGITATIFILVIKQVVPSVSFLLSLATCVLIFILILPELQHVVVMFQNFSQHINFKGLYIDIILKIIGISYITELAAQLCIDSGENGIASKIELSGKVMIMVASLPIINEILNTVLSILR